MNYLNLHYGLMGKAYIIHMVPILYHTSYNTNNKFKSRYGTNHGKAFKAFHEKELTIQTKP